LRARASRATAGPPCTRQLQWSVRHIAEQPGDERIEKARKLSGRVRRDTVADHVAEPADEAPEDQAGDTLGSGRALRVPGELRLECVGQPAVAFDSPGSGGGRVDEQQMRLLRMLGRGLQ
jgi:hypothetical protein